MDTAEGRGPQHDSRVNARRGTSLADGLRSTYASGDYRKVLKANEIKCSMSRKGDCWDNAVAESFFATLKREVEDIERFESRAQATATIGDYIDKFYNLQRRHSTIDCKSPIEGVLMYCARSSAA